MAITTRLGKGSALSHAELDTNFTDLDTRLTDTETQLDNYSPSLFTEDITLDSSGPNFTVVLEGDTLGVKQGLRIGHQVADGTTPTNVSLHNAVSFYPGDLVSANDREPARMICPHIEAKTIFSHHHPVVAIDVEPTLPSNYKVEVNKDDVHYQTKGTIYCTINSAVSFDGIFKDKQINQPAMDGSKVVLIIEQLGGGTWTDSVNAKYKNGVNTLSTNVGDIDIVTILYNKDLTTNGPSNPIERYFISIDKGYV